MKQVIQSFRSSKLRLLDVPEPHVRPGHLLVATWASVISASTERMVADLAKKSLLGKARRDGIMGGTAPIDEAKLIEVSLATILTLLALQTGQRQDMPATTVTDANT